jgi:hypothetical protein
MAHLMNWLNWLKIGSHQLKRELVRHSFPELSQQVYFLIDIHRGKFYTNINRIISRSIEGGNQWKVIRG